MFAVIELGRQKQTRKTVCEQTEQSVVVTHDDTASMTGRSVPGQVILVAGGGVTG